MYKPCDDLLNSGEHNSVVFLFSALLFVMKLGRRQTTWLFIYSKKMPTNELCGGRRENASVDCRSAHDSWGSAVIPSGEKTNLLCGVLLQDFAAREYSKTLSFITVSNTIIFY